MAMPQQVKNPVPTIPCKALQRIAMMVAILFCSLSIAGAISAAEAHIIFEPITARSDSPVEKWQALGVSEDAARALHTYATGPSAATALGVLKFYKEFAGDPKDAAKGRALRESLFAADKQLFQSVDAMKYEVVMLTQKRLNRRFSDKGGIAMALRVGSSAKRHQQWLDWARDGKNPETMPPLDSNRQFSSDDDVTNFAKADAEEANPGLVELLNGKTAAEEFVKASRDLGFDEGLDPGRVMIEFLSPTKAYSILRTEHPGEYIPVKPNFMAEWTQADQEKYNGLFAVEQLHEWAVKKGVVTINVDAPETSTMDYSHYAKTTADPSAPNGFSPEGLFAWMANNHRQIFSVHSGDLKSLAKYTSRMIASWRVLKLTPPAGDEAMYQLAVSIYDPPEGYKPPPGALDTLLAYNRTLIREAQKQNMQIIARHITDTVKRNSVNRPLSRGENFVPFRIEDLMGQNRALENAVNCLAVAYTNFDTKLIQELEIEIGEQIRRADVKMKNVAPMDGYIAHMATYLLKALETARQSAATSRSHTDAFVYLREELDKRINEHVVDIKDRLNLDTYLLKVAAGDFTTKELRVDWDGKRPVIAERVLDPRDVATDMQRLEWMARLFVWEEAPLAKVAKEYFEADDPGLAVRMIKLLRDMGDVAHAKPVVIRYKDADGNEIHQVVEVSKFQTGVNAGFLAFKAAMKGWKIWGDMADGRDLYLNLKKITSQAGLEPRELAQAQAQALANFINVLEYFQAGRFTHSVPAGGTLATLATLSGNAFQDDNAFTDLGIALFKDLAVAYQPYLIYAYALHGIGSWGWNKYSLYASKEDIIDLLVENGKWDIDDMSEEDKKRVQDPKLLGYIVWDGKSTEYLETDPLQLAKNLPQKVVAGIMLKKSKRLVDPRASMMDIAYRSGYIDQDPVIDIDVKAINDLFAVSLIKLPLMLTNMPLISSGSKDWTKKWLESSYGILVPTKDDDTRVATKQGKHMVQIATGDAQGWGTWTASWVDGVRYGMLKNLGLIMQDFWVKRQLLLEKVVWPEILKEAAKRKMKHDVLSGDADDLIEELNKLKERMKDLDRRVWAEVARSTDPFTGPLYDDNKDIPITEHWWKKIEPLRNDLKIYVDWVKTNKNNQNADPAADFPADFLTTVGSYFGRSVVVKTKDDVATLARDTIGKIIDILVAYEKAYDDTLKVLDDTKKMVKKLGEFDMSQCHVQLNPSADASWYQLSTTPEADTRIAKSWQDRWKEDRQQVNFDIGSVLINMGFKPPELGGPMDTIEQFQAWLTGRGPDTDVATAHPLWGDLMQLKMQIHKLKNMLVNVQEVSRAELEEGVRGMILKEVTKNTQGEEELKDVAVTVGGEATPAEREKKIRELISKMEDNYITLLQMVRQLFNLKITVTPETGHYLAQEIEVGVEISPRKFGPEQTEIDKIVKNFRYEIYGLEPGVSEGDLIVNEIVKEKTWKHHLSVSGRQKIRVQALGMHHMPFSLIEEEIKADTAHLKGELLVHGDFSGTPPFLLKFGKDPLFIHDMGELVSEGPFDVEIKRLNDAIFKEAPEVPQPVPFISFGRIMGAADTSMIRTHGLTQTPLATSSKVTASLSANIFSLDAPLEVELAANVTIDVTVKDSSGVAVEAEISAHSKDQTVQTPDPLLLRLMNKDPVWILAKRTEPAPGVSARSNQVLYDNAAMGNGMGFELTLPFFDVEHLTVKGRFTPGAGIEPAPMLSGGEMQSSLSTARPVGPDGAFTFTNERAVLLSEALTIYGLLYSDDDRMFKPRGGAYTADLAPGPVLDLGSIPIEPYEVKIDPITVKVVDQTGRTVPEANLSVFIGDEKIGRNGDIYSGTWTIKRKTQTVDVKAEFILPDKSKVTGAETLSAGQFNLLGTPQPPPPMTIALPMHLSLEVEGVSAILLPQGKQKPEKVKVSCPVPPVSEWFDMESPFRLTLNEPVRVGAAIAIDGKAKPLGDKILYEGSLTATVGERAVLQVGTLTLRSEKKKDFVAISGLKATGASGAGAPALGQPMKGAAMVTVGDHEGPLPVMEWMRLSDGYTDRQFKAHVTPGEAFSVTSDMPPLPKGTQEKHDTLELRISDDIDKEVKATLPFTWEIGDEFERMKFTSLKKGKTGSGFVVGEKIDVTGTWRIAQENGTNRVIVYHAGGEEFFRDSVKVTEGDVFSHSAVLDTKGRASGRTEIRIDLINDEPSATATGTDGFHLKEARDEIISAGAASAAGTQDGGKQFTQGDPLYVNAVIQAAEAKDGPRILQLQYQGKTILAENFDMTGDETVTKSFQINSSKLDASSHTFALTLLDGEGTRQDREIVRIRLAEDQSSQGSGQGGLQNVTCTGDTVNIKIWDHGAQDGDIITLRLGGRVILSGFDLNACGGSEPAGPPCAFIGLPFPAGSQVAVSITAHNEGSSSPNTAALKVEGGCTPELQHWGLKTGETASIFITRSTSTQPQGGQGTQAATGHQGGRSATQNMQSWP